MSAQQLTVRLPEDLGSALASAARRLQRKRSEIIRLALRQFLEFQERDTRAPSERVDHLLGSLDSGIPDLVENQRAYLLESLKREE